jgi:hypothetical protein
MANTTNTGGNPTQNTTNSANAIKVSALRDAGVSSLVIGLATGMTLFAVQAAVVAGKAVIADVRNLADTLRS